MVPTRRSRWFVWFAVAMLPLTGCGKNKFQQEVETEKSAVRLAREVADGRYTLITTDELAHVLDNRADVVLVDAMPAEASYQKAHIPGAVNLVFPKDAEMEDWDPAQTAGKTREDYEKLLGDDKDRPVIVYCGFVACLRSHNAALWAKRLGYRNVQRYPGGIYAWKGAGHATAASD